jgi:1A family penicillin-binding protein
MHIHKERLKSWFMSKKFWTQAVLTLFTAFLVVSGILVIWIATLRIPDLQSFQNKILAGSTKIYDKTGQVLLYNVNQDVKQQVVPFDQISQHAKDATIAIEDEKFYEHKGIQPTSIVRAILADIVTLKFSQGGSTITQQVIKNSLLTSDKRISRKIKEWVLALKLERVMTKDQILNLYLNSTSYGGTHYGIEVAARDFFGKSSKDLDVAESAYLAALPQAPSYYSPYGSHKDSLESRKNLVLSQMKKNGFITDDEYNKAKTEKVTFLPQQNTSIRAPHFVMFIKDYLTQKYGEDMVKNGGLNVTTTLDYDMQQKAEGIVKDYALKNTTNFNATNAGMVAIDPTTGQILVMVGSRDYFDKKIDGNYNVALAQRQPGSSFKPFAYVTAFNKGYTPDTVLFDLPTEFSTYCDPAGKPLTPGASCYMPENYDHKFEGPISLRNALAQSRNIPSIKTLYLAGIKDTLQTADDMGITSLTDPNRYGLTLVLGGGEVSLLEMTSAYSVFANNGIRNPYTGILKVTDRDGNVLEEFKANPTQVIPTQPTLLINDILHDNNARLPLNGAGSATDFPDKEVALKTGTTNDSRDAWIIGYTPHVVVGSWAGNNNNAPMIKKNPATSGLIVAPMWRAFMNQILPNYPQESFVRPNPIDPNLKPILRGVWQGGQTYTIDSSTGNLATDQTLPELRQTQAVGDVHTILYWVNKDDPTGPPPTHPENDPQFNLWETPIRAWVLGGGSTALPQNPPLVIDNNTNPGSGPQVSFTNPTPNSSFARNSLVIINLSFQSKYPINRAEYYVNNKLIGSTSVSPYSLSFSPQNISGIQNSNNDLKVVVYDATGSKNEAHTSFSLK